MQLDGKLRSLIKQLVEEGVPLKEACLEFEIKYIQEAVKINGGNYTRTAKAIGVHRNTIYNRLKGIQSTGSSDH